VANLGLESQPAYVTTYGLDGKVLSHARDSRKTHLAVSYFNNQLEQPVDEPEVLIVPMTAYDLVLGLPWFRARNPVIDWAAGKLLSLQPCPEPKIHGEVTSTEGRPDIQMLSATAFRDLCATSEVSDAFCLTLSECQGLLGATGGHPLGGELLPSPEAGRASRSSSSSCGRRAQA
jgi:hypothetical protein